MDVHISFFIWRQTVPINWLTRKGRAMQPFSNYKNEERKNIHIIYLNHLWLSEAGSGQQYTHAVGPSSALVLAAPWDSISQYMYNKKRLNKSPKLQLSWNELQLNLPANLPTGCSKRAHSNQRGRQAVEMMSSIYRENWESSWGREHQSDSAANLKSIPRARQRAKGMLHCLVI